MTGRIFSIEEFSTYDGPGIRMTVFLKGCPLRCTWCHNPEGQTHGVEIVRSPNGCLDCGACMKMGEIERGTPCLVPSSAAVCPRKLIRLCGEDLTPEALVEKIEKNVDVLNMSGGGVTFSGGEPLAQAEFVEACMRLLRGKTNRALQTSGYCKPDVFSRILKECDFVLCDLKLIDDEMHRRYTGVSNEWILENYRTLAASGVPFITRIPLIPTVNDTEENTRAMASLMRLCGVDRLEILPYNKMAGGKYLMLGREYEPGFDGSVEPTVRRDVFSEYGIEVRVL